MAAVAVVVGVGAGQNYQKERQFRALNQLNEDVKVRLRRAGCATHMSFDLMPGLELVLLLSARLALHLGKGYASNLSQDAACPSRGECPAPAERGTRERATLSI